VAKRAVTLAGQEDLFSLLEPEPEPKVEVERDWEAWSEQRWPSMRCSACGGKYYLPTVDDRCGACIVFAGVREGNSEEARVIS